MNQTALIVRFLMVIAIGAEAAAQTQDISGCTDPGACNYDPYANIEDGSCEFEQHPLIPDEDFTFGGPVLYWCGPLPDCSNPLVGCGIPMGYIPADPDCYDAVLALLPTCQEEWTSTCWAVYVECMLGIPGCTDPYACNYVDSATFDIGDCLYPGYPCISEDPCETDAILTPDCNCEGVLLDLDGDGICSLNDCNDNQAGIPDFLGQCPSGIAGCLDPEALNFNAESIHESVCIYPGDCGTWSIAENWTFGLQGWLAADQWSISDPELITLDERSLIIQGKDNDLGDTTWASIAAPTSMLLQFTFGYNTLDGGANWDPPILEVNGVSTGFVDYLTTTPPPGFVLAPLDTWAHGKDLLAPDGIGTDPFLLPPDQLLPAPFLPAGQQTWDYPYQVPIVLNLDSGDVVRFGVATLDGLFGAATAVFTAFTHPWFCLGCKDLDACNYDELATVSDGSCDYSCYGCLDQLACNFDPIALLEGECDYSCYGCLEPDACNYNETATLPDSCDYSCYGCPDPLACNFDPESSIDDESCEYCSCSFPPDIAAASGIPFESGNPGYEYYNQQATLLTMDGSLFDCPFITPNPQQLPTDWGQSIALDAGGQFILIMDTDSTLHGEGNDEFGQVSIPDGLGAVRSFSAGAFHAAAITEDGTLVGWGWNGHGQVDFPEVENAVGVEAGSRHTIAWDVQGHIVMAVGADESGQCTPPPGISIDKLSASEHNVALTTDGSVVCWGTNNYGQCAPPEFSQPVVDVAASYACSMALLADSSVVMWGKLPLPNPIEHVQAIDGNPLTSKFALLDYDGRVHQIDQRRYLAMQGVTRGVHAFSRPRCTEWCLDRDEDGLCDVEDPCVGEVIEPCGCICTNDENTNGICDEEEVRGCMDSRAANFNISATLPGECDDIFIVGCMSPAACNFNPQANSPSLCEFDGCGGCTDSNACNFEPEAIWDSGTCEYGSCEGCGDPMACNYNPDVPSTGTCDYCSCNRTVPKFRTHFSYHLMVNAQGEASFGGSVNILGASLGINEIDLSPLLTETWSHVEDGAVSLSGVVLLMEDGSLQSHAPSSNEVIQTILRMTQTHYADAYDGDVFIALLAEDLQVPEGNDFIDIAAGLDLNMALRSNGTVAGWGVQGAQLRQSVNPDGEFGPDEQVNLTEWMEMLTGVADVEVSGFANYHALLQDGTVSSYTNSNWALPNGFNEGIAEMVCSDYSCILRKEDGTLFAVEAYLDQGISLEEALEDPTWMMQGAWELGIPPAILAGGEVVQFDSDLVSAVLYSDGSVGAWMIGSDGVNDDFVRILSPEELGPNPVEQVIGGVQLHTIDDHSILRHMDVTDVFPALLDYMEQEGLDDPFNGLVATSVPDSIMLGHPLDCGQECPDADEDGICDGADDCFGERDALGICGGDCLMDADHDGICDLLDRPGCTYVESCSYLPEATWDDGSCVFSFIGPETDLSAWLDACPSDIDNSGEVATQDLLLLLGSFGLMCESDAPVFDPCLVEVPFACGDAVDWHGYNYATIDIGGHCWFQENLRTPHYSNGQAMGFGLDDAAWSDDETGAWHWADSDSAASTTYGLLYNGYAIQDPRGVCPWGWHVPTDEEWMTAELFVGLDLEEVAETGSRGVDHAIGSKFKANSSLWSTAGTNQSGFTGLPAGRRMASGEVLGPGNSAWYWTSSLNADVGIWSRGLISGDEGILRESPSAGEGYSVRCVKDF